MRKPMLSFKTQIITRPGISVLAVVEITVGNTKREERELKADQDS
jgi:hypothetical protein